MREILLDTETTGLDAKGGDRIIEIACIELSNHLPTGRTFQRYLNPEREIAAEAEAIHGLSAAFLADKPLFAAIADELLAFIGDAPLVIHNAEFDIGFINAELKRLERAPIPIARAIDTVHIARRKFPGSPASLDALCRRFNIDNSARTKHGALLDCELLAEVYLELVGGRQAGLELTSAGRAAQRPAAKAETLSGGAAAENAAKTPGLRPPRAHAPTAEEAAAHAAFLDRLPDPIWRR